MKTLINKCSISVLTIGYFINYFLVNISYSKTFIYRFKSRPHSSSLFFTSTHNFIQLTSPTSNSLLKSITITLMLSFLIYNSYVTLILLTVSIQDMPLCLTQWHSFTYPTALIYPTRQEREFIQQHSFIPSVKSVNSLNSNQSISHSIQ